MNFRETMDNLRMVYQARYVRYLKKYNKNNEDMDSHGHAMECSFALMEIFGLTEEEMRQLEKNDYAGLLDSDIF